MTEPEDDDADDEDGYDGLMWPDTLPEGSVHFAGDAQAFLEHWVGKLGISADGAALLVGEGLVLSIINPATGQVLTLPEIAKTASSGKVHRLQ